MANETARHISNPPRMRFCLIQTGKVVFDHRPNQNKWGSTKDNFSKKCFLVQQISNSKVG